MKKKYLFWAIVTAISLLYYYHNFYPPVKTVPPDLEVLKSLITTDRRWVEDEKNCGNRIIPINYTGYVENRKEELFDEYESILSLLKKNNIAAFYSCGTSEIWFVTHRHSSLWGNTETLVGYTPNLNQNDWSIKHYHPSRIRKIKENWYSMEVFFSNAD